mmetsp:Transcript_77656/g.170065  ORF Transcript_77656/g.170065 Transcript_77656/m.170065 type:complete len:112 (-) Transcript_77656:83-418(-)
MRISDLNDNCQQEEVCTRLEELKQEQWDALVLSSHDSMTQSMATRATASAMMAHPLGPFVASCLAQHHKQPHLLAHCESCPAAQAAAPDDGSRTPTQFGDQTSPPTSKWTN